MAVTPRTPAMPGEAALIAAPGRGGKPNPAAAYGQLAEAMAARNPGLVSPVTMPAVLPFQPAAQPARPAAALSGRDPDPGNFNDIGPIPEVADWRDIPRGMLSVMGPLGAAGVVGGLVLSHASGGRVTPSFGEALAEAIKERSREVKDGFKSGRGETKSAGGPDKPKPARSAS